jgi:hypothetical protein
LQKAEGFSFLFNVIVPSANLSTSPRALKNRDRVYWSRWLGCILQQNISFVARLVSYLPLHCTTRCVK